MAVTRRVFGILIPLALGLAVSAIASFTRSPGEGPLYRSLLNFRPKLEAADRLLLLDLDEAALEEGGAWPWPRESLAEALLVAAEFGAERLLLDLGLGDLAPRDAPLTLEEFRAKLGGEFDLVEDNVRTLFEAIRSGSIRPADSPRYVTDLLSLVQGAEERLLDLASPPPDPDLLLARAESFHGSLWLAYGLLPERGKRIPEARELAFLEAEGLGPAAKGRRPAFSAEGISMPPAILLDAARGTGFSAAGSRRTGGGGASRPLVLLAEYKGEYIPSAALSLLVELLGSPSLAVGQTGILLRQARLPGEEGRDLPIPLTAQGAVLLDRFAEGGGPRRLSLGELLSYRRLERELLAAFEKLDRSGYLQEGGSPASLGREAAALEAEILASGEKGRLGELRAARSAFRASAREALGAEERIVAYVEGLVSAGHLSDEEKRGLLELREGARKDFAKARGALEALESSESRLGNALKASIALIGFEGESLGAAAFLSAGLEASFLRELGPGLGLLLGGFAALLAGIAGLRFGAGAALAVGGGLALGLFGGTAAIFLRFGTYLAPAAPVLGSLSASLAAALIARFWKRADRSPVSAP